MKRCSRSCDRFVSLSNWGNLLRFHQIELNSHTKSYPSHALTGCGSLTVLSNSMTRDDAEHKTKCSNINHKNSPQYWTKNTAHRSRLPIIPSAPKCSSRYFIFLVLSNPFPSKPSIVFSPHKPFYSQPNYSSWWLGIFGAYFEQLS